MEAILKTMGQYGFPMVMCLLIYMDMRVKVNAIDKHVSNHIMHALVDIKEAIVIQTETLEKVLDKR